MAGDNIGDNITCLHCGMRFGSSTFSTCAICGFALAPQPRAPRGWSHGADSANNEMRPQATHLGFPIAEIPPSTHRGFIIAEKRRGGDKALKDSLKSSKKKATTKILKAEKMRICPKAGRRMKKCVPGLGWACLNNPKETQKTSDKPNRFVICPDTGGLKRFIPGLGWAYLDKDSKTQKQAYKAKHRSLSEVTAANMNIEVRRPDSPRSVTDASTEEPPRKRQRRTLEACDASLARKLQKNEETLAKRRKQKEKQAMYEGATGRALLLVEKVLQSYSSIMQEDPKNRQTAMEGNLRTVGRDDMVFLAEKMMKKQAAFKDSGKPFEVEVGYHYTVENRLQSIRQDGLLNKASIKGSSKFSTRNGAMYGDGIYTGSNPYAFKAYGDTGLLVAILKGTESRVVSRKCVKRLPANYNTVIGNKLWKRGPKIGNGLDEIVLRESDQIVPLLRYSSSLVGICGSLEKPGNALLWKFHVQVQKLLDEVTKNPKPVFPCHVVPRKDILLAMAASKRPAATAVGAATARPGPPMDVDLLHDLLVYLKDKDPSLYQGVQMYLDEIKGSGNVLAGLRLMVGADIWSKILEIHGQNKQTLQLPPQGQVHSPQSPRRSRRLQQAVATLDNAPVPAAVVHQTLSTFPQGRVALPAPPGAPQKKRKSDARKEAYAFAAATGPLTQNVSTAFQHTSVPAAVVHQTFSNFSQNTGALPVPPATPKKRKSSALKQNISKSFALTAPPAAPAAPKKRKLADLKLASDFAAAAGPLTQNVQATEHHPRPQETREKAMATARGSRGHQFLSFQQSIPPRRNSGAKKQLPMREKLREKKQCLLEELLQENTRQLKQLQKERQAVEAKQGESLEASREWRQAQSNNATTSLPAAFMSSTQTSAQTTGQSCALQELPKQRRKIGVSRSTTMGDSQPTGQAKDLPVASAALPSTSLGSLLAAQPTKPSRVTLAYEGSLTYRAPLSPASEFQGRSPSGYMFVKYLPLACGGYEKNGSFSITYSLPSGHQQSYHSTPGKKYKKSSRTAFLPSTEEGKCLLRRLKYAWLQGRTFAIGTSKTTKKSDRIVWATIPHKTSRFGGPFGYPDATYFDKCNRALDDLGLPFSAELSCEGYYESL